MYYLQIILVFQIVTSEFHHTKPLQEENVRVPSIVEFNVVISVNPFCDEEKSPRTKFYVFKSEF